MLKIAIVYTDKIPEYGEHLEYMNSSGITLHNTDCYLVLGQEYNEDVQGFIAKSMYNSMTVSVIPFNDLPVYQQTYNDIDERTIYMSNFYKNKAADLIEEANKDYGMVIYTHTNVLNIVRTNWKLLYDEITTTNGLYINHDKTFVCGSQDTMSKYFQNMLPNDYKTILLDLNTVSKTSIIEKYNVLNAFRGLEETGDSERYTERLPDETKSYSFENMKPYDTVYFSNLTLRKIYKQLRQIVTKPFILVTGEGDCECPNQIFETNSEFEDFIKWDKLKHWFCQNTLITHPKITLIPLGLDYHTMMYYSHIRGDRGPKITPIEQEMQLMDLRKIMKPFWERIPVCYGNFQFLTTTKYSTDRIDAIKKIPSNAIYYDCKHQRKQTFINQTSFAYVASPFGQDYECIRTWEALCLGCIVIIKTCPLDSLYEGLPVVIIQDWSEVTPEFLQKTLEEYTYKHLTNQFKYEKLHKHYWVRLVQQMKDKLIMQDAE